VKEKIQNLAELISIPSGILYINTFYCNCVIIFVMLIFLRLILNCDIENIDVRTTDPFDAKMLSDYETTNVTKILDESIFYDIYKFIK